jgi:hypothetical protein
MSGAMVVWKSEIWMRYVRWSVRGTLLRSRKRAGARGGGYLCMSEIGKEEKTGSKEEKMEGMRK